MTIVMIAPILLAMGALAVDLGQAQVARTHLQGITDHVARAGVSSLDGTEAGLAEARADALRVAGLNAVYGDSVQISEEDVELGYWQEDEEQPGNRFVPSEDPELVDSVRITARASVPTIFAGLVMSRQSLSVSARSSAMRQVTGAGSVECFIPLAIPDCSIETSGIHDVSFKLSPAGVDNTGFAMFSELGSPNTETLVSQIESCSSAGEAFVGDQVWLDNGEKASVLKAFSERIDTSTTTWDTEVYGDLPEQSPGSSVSNYGNVFEGPIIVFEGTESYCNGEGAWNESSMPIVGFAWGALYDVVDSGAEKNLRMRLDLDREHDFGNNPGGNNYGVVTYTPRLVL